MWYGRSVGRAQPLVQKIINNNDNDNNNNQCEGESAQKKSEGRGGHNCQKVCATRTTMNNAQQLRRVDAK